MKKYGISVVDFRKTYSNIINNSLQFENFCTKDPIIGNSRLGIFYWDNELLTTYLPSIIENTSMVDIRDSVSSKKYFMNPQRLSKDMTGITDYWYLILAMNKYTSRFDFKDFDDITLFPEVEFVNSLITKIERDRSNNL